MTTEDVTTERERRIDPRDRREAEIDAQLRARDREEIEWLRRDLLTARLAAMSPPNHSEVAAALKIGLISGQSRCTEPPVWCTEPPSSSRSSSRASNDARASLVYDFEGEKR